MFLDYRKQEDVENLRKLFNLSQEYMLNAIEQKIYQELIHKSKSLILEKDMEYAVPLFILADEVRCGEAIDNCIRVISENLKIQREIKFKKHFLPETTDTWTFLVKNENLREKSKAKLIGLLMKKNIKDLRNKNCDLESIENELNIVSNEFLNFNKRCNCNKV